MSQIQVKSVLVPKLTLILPHSKTLTFTFETKMKTHHLINFVISSQKLKNYT